MNDLLQKSSDTLTLLSNFLCQKLVAIIENGDSNISLLEAWDSSISNNHSNSSLSNQRLLNWLEAKNSGGSILASLKYILIMVDVLFRIHHHSITPISQAMVGGKEYYISNFDDVLRCSMTITQQILKRNIFEAVYNHQIDEIEKKGNKSSIQSANRRLICVVLGQFLPVIESILSPLSLLLSVKRQSDVQVSRVIDICMSLLKLDASTVVQSIDLNMQVVYHNVLVTTSHVLTTIFKLHSSHRYHMLMDLIPLISDFYSLKQCPTSISLDISSSGFHASNRQVSSPFALLLRLLQSSVMTSSDSNHTTAADDQYNFQYFEDPLIGNSETKQSVDQLSLFKDSFSECRRHAVTVTSEILKRCSHKEVSAEYRNTLARFVEELLLSISCPCYSVSTILLETLLVKLRSEILVAAKQSNNNDSSKRDTTHITSMLDVISTVGCHIRRVHLSTVEEKNGEDSWIGHVSAKSMESKLHSIKLQWDSVLQRIDASKSKKSKLTKDSMNYRGVLLKARADILQTYFSAIRETPSLQSPLTSYPMSTQILSKLSLQSEWGKYFDDNITEEDVNVFIVVEHFHALYLSSQSLSFQDLIKDSLAMILVQWLRYSSNHKHAVTLSYIEDLIQFYLPDYQIYCNISPLKAKLIYPSIDKLSANAPSVLMNLKSADTPNGSIVASDVMNVVYKKVITNFSLHGFSEVIMNILTMALTDPSPIIRARVVRSIHSLIRVDHNLFLSRPDLNTDITSRLHDVSISVREETVKLFGYVISFPNLFDKDSQIIGSYVQALRMDLFDPGVSVRKTVVQIFRDLLISQRLLDSQTYTDLCITLLERWQHPKEEAAVKELIMDTFQRMWFLPSSSQENSLTIKTAKSNQNSKKGRHDDFITTVSLQLLDIVLSSHMQQEWFVSLIRGVLHAPAEGDEGHDTTKSKREASSLHCNEIVEKLIDILISCEEARHDERIQIYANNSNRSTEGIITGVFLTLSIFCEVWFLFKIEMRCK